MFRRALPPALGALGFALWVALTAPGIPAMLLGLGVLVIVPLGVSTRIAWLALVCGVPLIAALGMPQGTLAGMLAVPWLMLTIGLAVAGMGRILRRGGQEPSELCVDTGHVLVLVGGSWALLDRLGVRPWDYDPLLVQLTAVHFHFAGFALPLLAGMVGRQRPGGTPRWIVTGILAGMPLVAGGLLISQITGWHGGEWLPSWLLAAAGMGVAGCQIAEAWRRPSIRSLLLALSGGALLVGMFMAGSWGLARAWGLPWPTMIDMFKLHGLLNAFGFSLLGLLARFGDTDAAPLPSPPLQHLKGRGATIGRGWFAAQGLTDSNATPPPGQLDRLEDLASPEFDAALVDPDIRHFYEHTDQYALLVRPRWAPLIAPLARLIVAGAGRVGQLVLPLDTGDWQRVEVEMLAAAPQDGPSNLRLYERHYADGRAMFIAAYATLRRGDRGWLAVALPLPCACIVSVMAMENLPDGGIRLRTRPAVGGDEAGFYLSTPLVTIRLPGHEDLRVMRGEDGLIAQHRVAVFGLTVMVMDYRLPHIA
ncbi:MAG: hypothetical protein ACI8RZ_001907 [Myxococcota bacterium]|jgi:hypothetical protein